MRDKDLFESITNALDEAVDGDVPVVDVMEVMCALTAIMAMQHGLSAAKLIYCFSATVSSIYDNDEEEDDEIAIH